MMGICHRRVLARRLMIDGIEHRTVIVEISDDGRSIAITPFEREVAATPYESRTLQAERDAQGRWTLKIAKSQ